MSLGNKLDSFKPAKRVGSLFDEFKNFAFKGNVVDLAIGVIIGVAFGTIVKSLTDNVISRSFRWCSLATKGSRRGSGCWRRTSIRRRAKLSSISRSCTESFLAIY